MTVESSRKLERSFVRDGLPWVVGAAALAVYLATLNHWVTFNSLALVSQVNGWNWQPRLSQPLLCLLTFPFRWLPAGWVPLTLNAFTAFCASLTLVTLARSVALLPHDRTEQQRLLVQNEYALLSLRNAWVPVVLAAIALGLQLTFWEHATAASSEMLDLLLFAYIIRCLLEHRIHERQSWLDRATLLFGCAMANQWAMVVFLPLFLVALLRTKRLSFFSLGAIRSMDLSGWENAAPAIRADLRFFLRMALLGLAGLTLFLVLPLVQAFSPDSTLSFWPALHRAAVSDKNTLHILFRWFWSYHRDLALLLAAASLLPVLLLSIRWSASAGGESRAPFDLAPFILRVFHAFLLLLCLWTVFDPPFSPRQIARQTGLPLFFLPLYYLIALCIGYYSGFFLLLFSPAALQRTESDPLPNRFFLLLFGPAALRFTRLHHTVRRVLFQMVPLLIYVILSLALGGLLLANVPAIRVTNAPHLDQYARLTAGSLPPEGAVVLSDDLARLTLLQAELAREGKLGRYVPVDTRSLPSATYRARLRRDYPGRWEEPNPEAKPTAAKRATTHANWPSSVAGLVQLVSHLAQSNRVYCLQPSAGALLEQFYFQPHGLVHEMKSYPANSLCAPPLTSAELVENQTFWQRAIESGVKPLAGVVTQPEVPRAALKIRLMELVHPTPPPPAPLQALARWYSEDLNRWGVALQRNGRWSEATPCFALAQDLNPDNLPVRLNLQCNSNLLAHHKQPVVRPRSFQDQFAKYRSWKQILTENGPIDEPSGCYLLGLSLSTAGMLRQACQQFDRINALVPGDVALRLMLGESFNRCSMPDRALQIVAEMRAESDLRRLGPTNEVEIAFLEASAWYAKTNRPQAEAIIYSLLATHPGDAALSDRAGAVFTAHQSYSNALRIVRQQLQFTPGNVPALVNQGSLYILMGDYSNAIPVLTRALSLTNAYSARVNRACAYLQTGRLDAAAADYQELLDAFPAAYRPYHGLGEIAWQKRDTNAAIRYYQQYLAKAVGDTDEARFVAARLKSLQQRRP